MSKKTDRLAESLQLFGLDRVETAVYLLLRVEGEMTALAISRRTKVARTRVYRVLDRLIELGLVNQKLGSRGNVFVASGSDGFELLVKKRELEVEKMKGAVEEMEEIIGKLGQKEKKETEVRYFKGRDGLKQVSWNSSKAEDELLIFEMGDMADLMDYGFAEKVREEFVERGVKVRELTNQKKVKNWTQVTEFVVNNWQCRYVSPKLLRVEYEMLIYNGVVTMYTLRQGDPFILEIHNPHIALMQRQLFEFVWSQSSRMKKVGKEGACRVEVD